MKYLEAVEQNSEVKYNGEYTIVYHSEESDNVYIKKYYENPFIKIHMNDTYNDLETIQLKAKKYGSEAPITWSVVLPITEPSTATTIDQTNETLKFNKDYVGNVTVTAKLGDSDSVDSKEIEIICTAEPAGRTYKLNPSTITKHIQYYESEATLDFNVETYETYKNNHKPEELISTEPRSVTKTFDIEKYHPVGYSGDTYPKNTFVYNKETVDLGLTSGNLWAKYNLGAADLNHAGVYCSWGDTIGYGGEKTNTTYLDPTDPTGYSYESIKVSGETETKTLNLQYKINREVPKIFTSITASYYDNERNEYTKYYSGDVKTELEQMDDIVYQKLGEGWSIPSKEDWEELIKFANNQTSATTSSTIVSGVTCWEITSNITHQTLYFPQGVGYREGINGAQGVTDTMWTNQIMFYNDEPLWHVALCFSMRGEGHNVTAPINRYCGCTVRGVFKSQNTEEQQNS